MCDESDEGEWCDYFYSLANFMWKKGILTDDVKNRAIEMIESGFGLDIWKESGEKTLNSRKKVLEKLKSTLLSPLPQKKKIKPNVFTTEIFENGDVIAIQLQTKNKKYSESREKPMSDCRAKIKL